MTRQLPPGDAPHQSFGGAMTVAREVQGAKVMLVNGCGHWVMVEHAALFNSLCLQFLEAAPGFEAGA